MAKTLGCCFWDEAAMSWDYNSYLSCAFSHCGKHVAMLWGSLVGRPPMVRHWCLWLIAVEDLNSSNSPVSGHESGSLEVCSLPCTHMSLEAAASPAKRRIDCFITFCQRPPTKPHPNSCPRGKKLRGEVIMLIVFNCQILGYLLCRNRNLIHSCSKFIIIIITFIDKVAASLLVIPFYISKLTSGIISFSNTL